MSQIGIGELYVVASQRLGGPVDSLVADGEVIGVRINSGEDLEDRIKRAGQSIAKTRKRTSTFDNAHAFDEHGLGDLERHQPPLVYVLFVRHSESRSLCGATRR